ncbi:uncharacterized protein LOC112271888 [Brachypodium distachyon]|uniref:uncharacterized protein LOC112271888 n=1 Tax=Brachypodium distachyon TaxID=15368 RepID=UPI000D0C9DB6|nr:uncharacterized protein LOC112271888 [Brachypodium distachyon]|eukprot:XP_024317870.1 uncharacterized protein LOC112271888 [Brachypodium distachyon]
MLVDGGSSLNLLAVQVMKKLQISQSRLRPTKTFQGINPGETQLLGQITLPATFGSASVIFDVEDILGRPSLAKFMSRSSGMPEERKWLGLAWPSLAPRSPRPTRSRRLSPARNQP